MKVELDKKLFDRFEFFHPERPPTEGLMCFGFECNDGWFDLIWNLCEQVEQTLLKHMMKIEVLQVKQKFGGLRFYWAFRDDFLEDEDSEDAGALTNEAESAYDEIDALVVEAEKKSYTICEICGKPGKPRDGGWICTLCDECNKT